MRRKLLNVDNNRNSQLLVETSLSKLADWLLEACSPEEALDWARSEFWDVILLELSLSSANGLVLFEQLQQDSKTSYIPIIFLTTRVKDYELEYYQQLNIAGVISKPFDPESLGQEIAAKLYWSDFQTLNFLP